MLFCNLTMNFVGWWLAVKISSISIGARGKLEMKGRFLYFDISLIDKGVMIHVSLLYFISDYEKTTISISEWTLSCCWCYLWNRLWSFAEFNPIECFCVESRHSFLLIRKPAQGLTSELHFRKGFLSSRNIDTTAYWVAALSLMFHANIFVKFKCWNVRCCCCCARLGTECQGSGHPPSLARFARPDLGVSPDGGRRRRHAKLLLVRHGAPIRRECPQNNLLWNPLQFPSSFCYHFQAFIQTQR